VLIACRIFFFNPFVFSAQKLTCARLTRSTYAEHRARSPARVSDKKYRLRSFKEKRLKMKNRHRRYQAFGASVVSLWQTSRAVFKGMEVKIHGLTPMAFFYPSFAYLLLSHRIAADFILIHGLTPVVLIGN